MPIPVSPTQQAYFEHNNKKPNNVASWLVFKLNHPDWSEPVLLAGLDNKQGVEFDPDFYTFEGVTYKPISMKIKMPNESKDDNGKMTISFSRAGTETKNRMKEITPLNARTPISFSFRQYQEGIILPVRSFDGNVSVNYPKISGSDVSVQASGYNPSLLTSQNIITLAKYPELQQA